LPFFKGKSVVHSRRKYTCFQNARGYLWRCKFLQRCSSRCRIGSRLRGSCCGSAVIDGKRDNKQNQKRYWVCHPSRAAFIENFLYSQGPKLWSLFWAILVHFRRKNGAFF
jgi:hypothetical protein